MQNAVGEMESGRKYFLINTPHMGLQMSPFETWIKFAFKSIAFFKYEANYNLKIILSEIFRVERCIILKFLNYVFEIQSDRDNFLCMLIK